MPNVFNLLELLFQVSYVDYGLLLVSIEYGGIFQPSHVRFLYVDSSDHYADLSNHYVDLSEKNHHNQ